MFSIIIKEVKFLKTKQIVKIMLVIFFICLIGVVVLSRRQNIVEFIESSGQLLLGNNILDESEEEIEPVAVIADPIVFDGLTKQELIDKINRSLKNKLEGTGESFVNHSLNLGVDPYLAVAIALHETGCNGKCSRIVNECNNVGGMKGSPKCNGSSYAMFDTLDEGIEKFINNLYKNYYSYGLTTPEAMNRKYAADQSWAGKVNYYINKIKTS